VLGRPLQKCLRLHPSCQVRPGWIWHECSSWIHIDWRSQIFSLISHFQDDDHEVLSRRKVLPPGDRARSVCPVPMQQRTPVPDLYSKPSFVFVDVTTTLLRILYINGQQVLSIRKGRCELGLQLYLTLILTYTGVLSSNPPSACRAGHHMEIYRGIATSNIYA